MGKGLFISFEGGEGAGKTTQINKLARVLTEKKKRVVTTREPGGTPEGEKIRELLVQRERGDWNPLSETLMVMAARAVHLDKIINPALQENKIVVSDRFHDSTYAYQGYGHGLPFEHLDLLHQTLFHNQKPDLTFIIDIDPEIGLARSARRTASQTMQVEQREDRFEQLNMDFHKRVREGFLEIAQKDDTRCVVIDGHQEIDYIFPIIRDKVLETLG